MTNFPQSLGAGHDASSESSIRQLRKIVAANTARWRRTVLLQALGVTIAVPLAFLWVMLWLDNMLHLPMWGRFLGFAGFIGLLGFLIVRLVQQMRQLRLTEDQVALDHRTAGARGFAESPDQCPSARSRPWSCGCRFRVRGGAGELSASFAPEAATGGATRAGHDGPGFGAGGGGGGGGVLRVQSGLFHQRGLALVAAFCADRSDL